MNKLLFFTILMLGLNAFAQQKEFEWARTIGSQNRSCGSVSIVVDSNKSVFVCGYFEGKTDFDPGNDIKYLFSNGGQDIFIAKYDYDGNYIWAKSIGGVSYDAADEMRLDKKGNLILTGTFSNTVDMDPNTGIHTFSSPGSNKFLLKLSHSGDFIWAHKFNLDDISTLDVDYKNNIVLGGIFSFTRDFDPGDQIFELTAKSGSKNDFFILKLDEGGGFIWAKQFKNLNGGRATEKTLRIDSKNNILFGGWFSNTFDFDPGSNIFLLTSKGEDDAFLVKIDQNGDFKWAHNFGGVQTDVIFEITIDQNDDIISCGRFMGTVDFNPGPDSTTLTTKKNNKFNAFILKVSANGTFQYAKSLYGDYSDGAHVVSDKNNNVYMFGQFSGTVDFDPGIKTFEMHLGQLFTLKLDSIGNFVWAAGYITQSSGGFFSIYTDITVDDQKNIFTTGSYTYPVDFDPSKNKYVITPNGNWDTYIHKLSQCKATYNYVKLSGCDSLIFNNKTYYQSASEIITLPSSFLGCDSTIELDLTINNTSLDLGSDTSLCLGQDTISINAPDTFAFYQWSNGSIANSISITDTGQYYLKVTDKNGCVAYDSIFVFLRTDCQKEKPPCMLSDKTILYPNPVSNQLTILKNPTSCNVHFNMYNTLGQALIKDYPLNDGKNHINLWPYANAIYFYTLTSKDEVLKSGKILKDHYNQ